MEAIQDVICKVIIKQGPKVLLLKRSRWVLYHRNRWDMPGGASDSGEDHKSTAVRECFEEAGIKIQANNLSLIAKKVAERKGRLALRVCFYVSIEERLKPKLSFEHSKYEWMSLDELLATDLPDFYKEACKKVLD